MDNSISDKLELLRKDPDSRPMICVTYCNRENKQTMAMGLLDRIDDNKCTLLLSSGIEIPFSEINSIMTWGELIDK